MDSYSKRYPLRNSSPPVPDSTLGHGEPLFGSWYKYSIEDGHKVFYYNSKTYERTWSFPKRRIVDVYHKLIIYFLSILFFFKLDLTINTGRQDKST